MAVPSSSAPTTTITNSILSPNEDGLLRLELIPYHAQRRRRRLERERFRRHLQESGNGKNDNNSDDDDDLEMHRIFMNRPHQYQRRRQLEQGRDKNEGSPMQVAELFQGYGTHYCDLWVGTEPQRQTVIVDTGSGVTAFPCLGCNNCGVPQYHASPLFDQTKSSTFHKLSCNECLRGRCQSDECYISMSYQEGSSWYAFEALDECYAGGLHSSSVKALEGTPEDDLNPFLAAKFSFGLKFGCQTSITGLFITQLDDGIMGLDNAKGSFVQQMHKAGKIPNRSFSLCYSRQDSVDPEGTESGLFTLGGSDERLHKTKMVWSSVSGGGGFYGIKIRNMYLRAGNSGDSAKSTDPKAKVIPLGLSEAAYEKGEVIVDSGTTDTYFSRSIGNAFGPVFEQLSGQKYGHTKKNMKLNDITALPTILIQIYGEESRNKAVRDAAGGPVAGLAEDIDPDHPYDVILAIPPTHYMEFDPDEEIWVNRFYTDEPSGGVIGGNAIMGHDVYFDVDNNQIGWAEASCSYLGLINQFDFKEGTGVAPSREQLPSPKAPELSPVAEPTPAPPVEPAPQSQQNFDDDFVKKKLDSVATFSQFCSSPTCQGGLASAIILVVALVAVRVIRRGSPTYQLSDEVVAELELQDAEPDSAIRYRDQLQEDSFQDEGHA